MGVFLIAACVFAALSWRMFLGRDFGGLVTDLVRVPHHLSLELIPWGAIAILGLWLALSGIRPALEEGDDAPWLPSLMAVAISLVAIWRGWYPPAAWGAVWPLASEGFYVALTAAGGANLCLTLGARTWMMGYLAASDGNGTPRSLPGDLRKWRQIVERQTQQIESLTAEGARAIQRARETEAVLLFPTVKKSVLKALHPDGHPDAGSSERRLLTERFQQASAVFDRLGAR
jgi:hypothetical protein